MSGTDRLITLERLQVVLDAYGAEPGRWPTEERAGAVALIESSDEARALFEEAAELDGVLDHVAEPIVSPALARRVRRIEMPPRHWRMAGVVAAIGDWLQPGSRFAWQSAVATAAIVGLVAGMGFSSLVFDHRTPPSRIAAVAADAGATPAPAFLIGGIGSANGAGGGSLALERNVQQLSLTGRDGTGNGSAYLDDDSDSSIASIPLY